MCLLPASCRKPANPKLLPLPEELCISFHRHVFFPVVTCSWPIIDTRRNVAETSLARTPLRAAGRLPCPALVWWVCCVFTHGVTVEGAVVLLQKMPGVSSFYLPHAHKGNAAHWEMPALRETKGALCHLVFVWCRKSIPGNPPALTCVRLMAYKTI